MDTTTTALSRYPDDHITITPLKGRSTRVDVEVRNTDHEPAAMGTTNIVDHLRRFFDELDKEAETRSDDPIAMVTALANLDALLADVRYVRDTVRKHAATGLVDNDVRRLAIEGVAAVEASSTLDRKWHDDKLMRMALEVELGDQHVNTHTGEKLDVDALADQLLTWFGISYWRMGALKPAGIDPDTFSDYPTDDDGKPARQPAVTMKVNNIRRQRS